MVCGGMIFTNQLSSLCGVIPIGMDMDGFSVPELPYPLGYTGHAVINDSLLWISGKAILTFY